MLAATRLLALFVEWSFESERKIPLLPQILVAIRIRFG
jgi:hypothetical protein